MPVVTITAIVQVEYRQSLLLIREDILQSLGHPVVSVLGSRSARSLDLSGRPVGVIMIGHGAPWQERVDPLPIFGKFCPGFPSWRSCVAVTRLSA